MALERIGYTKEISQLLKDWNNGDQSAFEQLVPLVYDELHRIARRQLRRGPQNNIIQTTVLVHEAFLRLVGQQQVSFSDHSHFFAVAAKAMRQILVNFAVARKASKRSGCNYRVSLDKAMALPQNPDLDIVELNDALNNLAVIDNRKSEIIEMRFFGGLTLEEIAEVLNLSLATVNREWKLARAWLLRELKGDS
jgi:RNA polymerase sigma factor (TIGR02999 family)